MSRALRLSAALSILSVVGLFGPVTGRARAQVPYSPYSLPRARFNQYAPSYYPPLPNYTVGLYPPVVGYGYGYGSGYRYGGSYGRSFRYGYRAPGVYSRGFRGSAYRGGRRR